MPELSRTAAALNDGSQTSAISGLFKQVHNIPSVPKLVQELIEQFGSNSSRVDDISKKIQHDQALSLKVLRLANSARYGAGRKVSSIDSAVVLLGFDTLKTLVIASGVTSACKSIPGMDREQFWRRAFSVANIAKLLARQARKDSETAFTCGLLHNIGEALIYLAHSEKMQRIDQLAQAGADRAELQRDQFGYDFMQVGAELTNHWQFPATIAAAIRFQANPDAAGADRDYAAIVQLASAIYRQVETHPDHDHLFSNIPVAKLRAVGVDPLVFMEKLRVMLEQEDDINSLLS